MKNLIDILRLAIPLVFIQLCQASLGLVDTLIAGQYDYRDLAGVGLGSSMWTPVFIFFTGVLYVLVPKFSAASSSNDPDGSTVLFFQGKYVASLLAALGFVVIHVLAFVSPFLIRDQQVALVAKGYLHFIAFGVPGLVYMLLYRFASEGNSILRPIMITGLFLLIVHAVLAFLFVNGFWLFPPMGGAGAGLATAVSAYLALIFMRVLVLKSCPVLMGLDAGKGSIASVGFGNSLALFKEGLPIGLTLVLQILALTMLAFFASSLGAHVVAAHQIMITIAMVVVMIPLALSSATTIRIAAFHAVGDYRNKQSVGFWAFLVVIAYGALLGSFILIFGGYVIGFFSEEHVVIEIALGLVVSMALFQFFDAVQMVASGVLRGLAEFIKPFVVVILSYWVVIIPVGYFVGVRQLQDVRFVWAILAFGIFLAAGILCGYVYRFLVLDRTA